MNQTLVNALVTAFITIIVTVVTVRLTMTGQIFSQTAKDKVKTKAKNYGLFIVTLGMLVYSLVVLASKINKEGPITRADIGEISVYTNFCFFWFMCSLGVGLWLYANWRHQRVKQ